MRGGNRSKVQAAPGVRPPPPPASLDPAEKELWDELASMVEKAGTFQATDVLAFRLAVRAVHRSLMCPLDAPPSASARLAQDARVSLESFGLSPIGRQRVDAAPPPKSVVQRYLEETTGDAK